MQIQALKAEERLADSERTKARLQNEAGYYKDEHKIQKAKNGLLELYASNLHKTIDALTQQLRTDEEELEKAKGSDWSRRILECYGQISELREQLLKQREAYEQFKAQLKAGGGPHFEAFLEGQAKELQRSRSMVR